MATRPNGSWNETPGLACLTHGAFFTAPAGLSAHLEAELPRVVGCHVVPLYWAASSGTVNQGVGAVQVGLSIGTFYRPSLASGSPIQAPGRWRQVAWTFAMLPTVAAPVGIVVTQARQGGGGTLAQVQVGAGKFAVPSLEAIMAWVGPGPQYGSYRFRQTGLVAGTFMGGQEWTT